MTAAPATMATTSCAGSGLEFPCLVLHLTAPGAERQRQRLVHERDCRSGMTVIKLLHALPERAGVDVALVLALHGGVEADGGLLRVPAGP
jgi:hypothetical protein